ncbi:hypothetical protein BJ742DRAFT_775915 [Cladochytrium replicatum]|nr:hypothetical protein BJ742DRAFT_775915 [Cladochytrium replicatum]
MLGTKEKMSNGSGSQSKSSQTKTGDQKNIVCTLYGQKGHIRPKCTWYIKAKLKAQKPKGNAAKAKNTDDMDIDSDSGNQSTPNLKVRDSAVSLLPDTLYRDRKLSLLSIA